MKKIILLLLFIPVIGMSQKNILTSTRIFCKTDKIPAFKAALAAHAKKFHSGDWNWRVWAIQSGPDARGYMVSEGPSNWETMDGRGEINPDHQKDWENNVAPFTTSEGSTTYNTFQPDLSTVKLTDYADKIQINHITAKPGKIVAVQELIKKLNKVWEASTESVAVYSVTASGEPGFTIVTRLKAGFKELDDNYRKPLPERFNTAYGAGAWDVYLKDYADAVQSRWSELLIYQPKLSSQ